MVGSRIAEKEKDMNDPAALRRWKFWVEDVDGARHPIGNYEAYFVGSTKDAESKLKKLADEWEKSRGCPASAFEMESCEKLNSEGALKLGGE